VRRLLASWFGTGFIPRRLAATDQGAGTVGALFALIPALLLGRAGWGAQVAGAVLVTAGALWSTRPYAVDGADPDWVVIDEAAGTFVAVLGLGGWEWIPAFLMFRLADITKRLPGVSAAERLPGSLGVAADDLVAGAWGLAAGWAVRLIAS
jgi:phosphatidylglycerophosphatase A